MRSSSMIDPVTSIESLVVGETSGGLSLVLSPMATVTFDRSSRPVGFYENGFYIARGLDGRCVEKKWLQGEKGSSRRHIRFLPASEEDRLRGRLLDVLSTCVREGERLTAQGRARRYARGEDVPLKVDELLSLVRMWEDGIHRAWNEDNIGFHRVWKPVGILPPDQYLSVVIQVVEGCAWNKCSFCDFYSGRPSRVRSMDEIRRHVDDVERFLGPSLSGRCSLFLGDANALQAPPSLLIPVVEELSDRFPRLCSAQEDGVGGIYSFANGAGLSAWTLSDLRILGRAGYRRSTIGLETGSDLLRRAIDKSGSAEAVKDGVLKLKGAGISVGLIVLLGVGGRENASTHITETARFLRDVSLGKGDLVYFSPLVFDETSGYAREANGNRWTTLSEDEMNDQRKRMESEVPNRGERRAVYDVREFVY